MSTAKSTRQRFECDQCNKSYTQKSKLRFHKSNIHGTGSSLPTVCSYCAKKFSSKCAKHEHERTIHMGARTFQCEMCDKRFERAAFLYGHKRSHHSALKLKCEKCQGTFSYVQSLTEHQGQCGKTEKKREQHNYPLCDACFTTRRAARLHERSSHGDAKHVCEECGNSCRYRTSLRKHKKEKH